MQLSQIPHNPQVLLYGYGLEGKSTETWLTSQFPDSQITVFEDSEDALSPAWEKYDLIVKSPGVPPSSIPDSHWPKVTSNLRLFLENLNPSQLNKVIGITGSKGKSTTAKFTHELLQTASLKSAIIGNYGVPALDVWNDLDDLDYVVAECSSFQLYDLKVSPKYAVFLSFFADHLDWHNSSEIDYLAAKSNLWQHQSSADHWFLPSLVWNQIQTINVPSTHYLTTAIDTDLFPKNSTLQAAHFRQNLGTVWQLAKVLKISNLKTTWQAAAAEFQMIEHRLEDFLTRDGFTFYNDSIATSPDATIKAVEYLGENLAGLILDGQDTGLDGCEALAKTLETQAPQARVALIESDIANSFNAVKSNLEVQNFKDYASALNWLLQLNPGAILFSPGGKSFNRFKNYSERGRVFKELVMSSRFCSEA